MIKKIAGLIKATEKQIPGIDLKLYNINKKLYFLGIDIDYKKWAGFSITLLLLLFLISSIIGWQWIIFSFILSAYVYYLPLIKSRELEARMEAELPLFLRNLGVLINIGVDFKKALEMASNSTSYLKDEIRRMLKDIEMGAGTSKAISKLTRNFESTILKRGFSQILVSYETGKGDNLKVFGDELFGIQRYKIKEYSSKLSIFSLMFIMVSVIAPVFFIMSSLLSPITGANTISKSSFEGYLFLVFPGISLLILLVSKMFVPHNMFEKEREDFSIIFTGIILALVFYIKIELTLKAIAGIIISFILIFYLKKARDREIAGEEIEKNIAEALLVISSIPESAGVKGIFERIANSNLGHLSSEFRKSLNQIKANINLHRVIEDLKKNTESSVLNRVLDVFEYSISSGVSVNKKMAEMADDILSYLEIQRERIAMLSMQKYTLMMGIVLIAIIIGKAYAIVSSLNQNVVESVPELIAPYIIINSAIVSWFSSSIEGRKSRAPVYFLTLSSISIIIFYYIIG